LSRHFVLNTRADLGYGDSYGDDFSRNVCFTPGTTTDTNGDGVLDTFTPGPAPTEPCETNSPDYVRTLTAGGLPFFENFYAGGVRSVRGFSDNTLGPRAVPFVGASFAQPIGGALKTTGSLEMIFPTLLDTPAARVSAFIDVGNVFADVDAFDAGELRASTGVSLMWRSPMGPISISYALPLRKKDGDEIERLQFTFGGVF
jgi:outer membrane protein insertion porin family